MNSRYSFVITITIIFVLCLDEIVITTVYYVDTDVCNGNAQWKSIALIWLLRLMGGLILLAINISMPPENQPLCMKFIILLLIEAPGINALFVVYKSDECTDLLKSNYAILWMIAVRATYIFYSIISFVVLVYIYKILLWCVLVCRYINIVISSKIDVSEKNIDTNKV
jgi:hypothetical protein